ncbi:MAG: 50S ribosomal protein L21e [Nanoarchaeota archaeon]
MVKRIGGSRRKTRQIFSKKPRMRGKFSLTSYFKKYNGGDKVLLKSEPSIHNGMYFKRFDARAGIIAGKQGRCYKVKINDLGKEKLLIVHPIHLRSYA